MTKEILEQIKALPLETLEVWLHYWLSLAYRLPRDEFFIVCLIAEKQTRLEL